MQIIITVSVALLWAYNLISLPKGRTNLRVMQNCVVRRKSGPNREEVTGEWKKCHNEEVHNLYSSSDIIRDITDSRGKGKVVPVLN
jgi:hypothetical protein